MHKYCSLNKILQLGMQYKSRTATMRTFERCIAQNVGRNCLLLSKGAPVLHRSQTVFAEKYNGLKLPKRLERYRIVAPSFASARQISSRRHLRNTAAATEDQYQESVTDRSIPDYCSGCGVKLQKEDSDSPGYFQLPKSFFKQPAIQIEEEAPEEPTEMITDRPRGDPPAELEEASTSGRHRLDDATEEALARLNSLFDDEILFNGKAGRAGRQRQALEDDENMEEDDSNHVLCARCYSLQHYGKVKSEKAEASLPEFDLGKKVGRKIALQKFRRPVVLCVVDIADFDGSLPRMALRALLPRLAAGNHTSLEFMFHPAFRYLTHAVEKMKTGKWYLTSNC